MTFQVLLGKLTLNWFLKSANEVSRAKWVKVDGVQYKVDVGVILEVNDDDQPVVG